jgi:hypothetical protein
MLENNINRILEPHLIVKTIGLRWFFDKVYNYMDLIANYNYLCMVKFTLHRVNSAVTMHVHCLITPLLFLFFLLILTLINYNGNWQTTCH